MLAASLAVAGTAWLATSHAFSWSKPVKRGEILSGAPALRETALGTLQRWHETRTTVYLDASLDRLGPGAREAVMAAFVEWRTKSPLLPEVVFDTIQGTQASLDSDGKSVVLLAPIPFAGHEDKVGVTVGFATEDGELREADIVLNERYAFGVVEILFPPAPAEPGGLGTENDGLPGFDGAPENRVASSVNGLQDQDPATPGPNLCGFAFDVQNLVAHEVGHFYGLGEDMTEVDSTMFFQTEPCETRKRSLWSEDIAVVTELYVAPVVRPPASQASGKPVETHATIMDDWDSGSCSASGTLVSPGPSARSGSFQAWGLMLLLGLGRVRSRARGVRRPRS